MANADFTSNKLSLSTSHQKFYAITPFLKENKLTLSLMAVMVFSVCCHPEANAADLTAVGTKLKTKINDIAKVLTLVTGAGAGLGFLWFVFSLIRSEPNYRYAGTLVVAGSLLCSVAAVTSWFTS